MVTNVPPSTPVPIDVWPGTPSLLQDAPDRNIGNRWRVSTFRISPLPVLRQAIRPLVVRRRDRWCGYRASFGRCAPGQQAAGVSGTLLIVGRAE
jgi:hypothetical protein